LGAWLIRPGLSRIERGATALHVTPRAMAVLVYLAQVDGAVVSRNAILDAVWPRMAVTPDALARCLVELRKAFGDGAEGTRLIETIPKVGLRLTLPVTSADDAAPAPVPVPPSAAAPTRRSTSVATAGLAGVVGAVAFGWWFMQGPAGASGDSSNPQARAFYASALEYAKRPNRLEALGHQEDPHRRAVDADPEFALAWARLGFTHTSSYWYGLDRTPARLGLAEQALRRALALRYDLPEVHLYLADFYFKGRGDGPAALAELDMAERTMARNPDPELYFLRQMVQRRAGEWPLAAAAGARAVELDPSNLVYRRQLHLTYVFMRDYARAESVLDDMTSLFPDDGTTFVDKAAFAMQVRGDTSVADGYEARAPSAQYERGLAYAYTRWLAAILDRDYERALRVLADSSEDSIFNGDLRTTPIPRAALAARTYRLAGNTAAAQAEFELVARDAEARLAAGSASDAALNASLHLTLAEAQAALGQRETALASMRSALALLPKSADAIQGSATQLGAILRVLIPAGELDAALRELDDYLAGPGHWALEGLLADPQLEPLRADPRTAVLLAKHRRAAMAAAPRPGA
jgi:DNA-binding winged helix-turn-helix (wHTH) protein/tetratricopeptide (TPR) repeat protein